MKCKTKSCRKQAGKFKYCPDCRAKIRAANDRFRGRVPGAEHPCEGGCGTMIPARRHFCDDCLSTSKKAKKQVWNASRYKPQPEPDGAAVPVTGLRAIINEANQLRERRAELNQELLAARLLRGAEGMCGVVG